MSVDIRGETHLYTHKTCGTDSPMPHPVWQLYANAQTRAEFTQLECVRCGGMFPIAEFTFRPNENLAT